MDFAFTSEQRAIQQLARDFAQKEVAPFVAEWDRLGTYPAEIPRRLGQLGLMGGVLQEEYGGAGMDHISLTLMLEELARVCFMTAVMAGWPSCSLGRGIMTYGTEEQKRKYIVPLVRGEKLGGTGVTEPHSGTDIVRQMQTTAVKDGDAYLISGTKTWISNLHLAQWFITFATLDKSLGHRGICAFVVEKNWPGVSTHPFKNLVGARTHGCGELVLDRVRVPQENLVGREYEGYKVLMAGTEIGRLACAARAVGQIQACLDESIKYAQSRIVFGQPIGKYQLIQAKITDMVVGLEAARLLTYKLAWLKDQGVERVQREASIAKMYATDVLMQAALNACQIYGAYSCSDEYPVGRFFRDAKFQQILDGTNEIHRVIIAEHALGYRPGRE